MGIPIQGVARTKVSLTSWTIGGEVGVRPGLNTAAVNHSELKPFGSPCAQKPVLRISIREPPLTGSSKSE
jgi:hypothetical protein